MLVHILRWLSRDNHYIRIAPGIFYSAAPSKKVYVISITIKDKNPLFYRHDWRVRLPDKIGRWLYRK